MYRSGVAVQPHKAHKSLTVVFLILTMMATTDADCPSNRGWTYRLGICPRWFRTRHKRISHHGAFIEFTVRTSATKWRAEREHPGESPRQNRGNQHGHPPGPVHPPIWSASWLALVFRPELLFAHGFVRMLFDQPRGHSSLWEFVGLGRRTNRICIGIVLIR